MAYQSETKTCQNCKNDFTIEPNDFGFYEKIHVPPPTFCPGCRRQRRWAWRNNMSLYNRKCDLCQKSVISIYSPDSGLIVYCNKCWWSDKWDPKSYGVEYDFSKPFFTQFKELINKVPHMSVVNDDGIASVDCEYTHDWWFSKNCYMCFSGWYVQNVMYSFFVLKGKDIMDCMNIRSESNWIYECTLTSLSYRTKYSHYCLSCMNSQFLYNCWNCIDCFMCMNLRNKKYYFKNKEYRKEEYEEIIKSYKLDTFSGVEKAREEFEDLILKYPHRYLHLFRSVNSVGDILSDSKNVKYCYVTKNSENCSYSEYTGDKNNPNKDSYDLTLCGGVSECYEGVVLDHSQMNLFGLFSVKSQDIKYTQHCHNGKHLLGCVGLRNTNYSIFNKQYSKEEYEELLPKIIKQMNNLSYVDKIGNEYRYGEYFPTDLSYFGYNESCAMEQFSLSKQEALQKGFTWQDHTQRTIGKETLTLKDIPESIHNISESILNEVLACINCKRNYKIIPNELIFYKNMGVPIPRRCFYCRHEARVKKWNRFKLWHRACMCDKKNHFHGAGKCEVEFETSYAPDRPEIVYCEKCYQAEVY